VDPPDFRRLWADLKPAFEQPLIEAITWPEHQLVLAGPDRIFVTVGGRVLNREDHQTASLTNANRTMPDSPTDCAVNFSIFARHSQEPSQPGGFNRTLVSSRMYSGVPLSSVKGS